MACIEMCGGVQTPMPLGTVAIEWQLGSVNPTLHF